jgi:hypothetical protein
MQRLASKPFESKEGDSLLTIVRLTKSLKYSRPATKSKTVQEAAKFINTFILQGMLPGQDPILFPNLLLTVQSLS